LRELLRISWQFEELLAYREKICSTDLCYSETTYRSYLKCNR